MKNEEKNKKKYNTTTIYLSKDKHDFMKDVAEREDRSFSYCVSKLIEREMEE